VHLINATILHLETSLHTGAAAGAVSSPVIVRRRKSPRSCALLPIRHVDAITREFSANLRREHRPKVFRAELRTEFAREARLEAALADQFYGSIFMKPHQRSARHVGHRYGSGEKKRNGEEIETVSSRFSGHELCMRSRNGNTTSANYEAARSSKRGRGSDSPDSSR